MNSESFKSEHNQNQKIKKKRRKMHDRSCSFCNEDAKFWCPESKKKFCQEHNKEFHPTEMIERIHRVEKYTNQNTHKECICEKHNIQKKFFKDDLICIECLVDHLFEEGKLRKGTNKTFFRDSEQSEQYNWETNRLKDRKTKLSQKMEKIKEKAFETKRKTEMEKKKQVKKLDDQGRGLVQLIETKFEKFTNDIISIYQSKIDLIDKKIDTDKVHLKEFNKSKVHGEQIQEAYNNKIHSFVIEETKIQIADAEEFDPIPQKIDVSPNCVSFISNKKLINVKSNFNSQQILCPESDFVRVFVDFPKTDSNSDQDYNSDSVSVLDFDSSSNSNSEKLSNSNLKILTKSNSENENENENDKENENENETVKGNNYDQDNNINIESGSDKYGNFDNNSINQFIIHEKNNLFDKDNKISSVSKKLHLSESNSSSSEYTYESGSSSDSELKPNPKKKLIINIKNDPKKTNTYSESSSGPDITPSSDSKSDFNKKKDKYKSGSESVSGSSSDLELKPNPKKKLIINIKNDPKKTNTYSESTSGSDFTPSSDSESDFNKKKDKYKSGSESVSGSSSDLELKPNPKKKLIINIKNDPKKTNTYSESSSGSDVTPSSDSEDEQDKNNDKDKSTSSKSANKSSLREKNKLKLNHDNENSENEFAPLYSIIKLNSIKISSKNPVISKINTYSLYNPVQILIAYTKEETQRIIQKFNGVPSISIRIQKPNGKYIEITDWENTLVNDNLQFTSSYQPDEEGIYKIDNMQIGISFKTFHIPKIFHIEDEYEKI
ncbi:hypothetical protein M0812_11387 [Anaeramoeba flamelloides]|uniref:B box-type domain-containing protein n=1 Tax=Anaeramoeba flamelloides TaxID=1746091 RepID=A0AAV8A012_9EUKA|nr:hypothetical protein M0812_11387 [Anaeramoeba flamelloides]